MTTQGEALYRVQELELGIANGQKRIAEIAAIMADNAVVTTAQKQVVNAQNTLKPLQTKMRDLELEIQSNRSKSKTTEDQLYSGKVKNPKQLEEMQQEINSLKQWHGELENRLLETMVAVEDAETNLGDAESQLSKVTNDWEHQNSDLLKEKDQIEKRIATLQAQRKEALTHVTPENLKTYAGMKPRKSNQPMALLTGRSCAVCGIEQTSAIEQEVRRGLKLTTCEGCGRILVHLGS